MYVVDGIAFDEYYVESVTLNVIYHKDQKRITRTKQFIFPTTCDVDINEYIKKVEILINA